MRRYILTRLGAFVLSFSFLSFLMHFLAHGIVRVEEWANDQRYYLLGLVQSEVAETFNLEPVKPPLTPKSRDELIIEASEREGVPPMLSFAVMRVESGENPNALSSAGAIGLFQVMPANHKRCHLKHPGYLWEEEKNIACGVKILAEELRTYKKTKAPVINALRAYNGGHKCTQRDCGEENRAYPYKVLEFLARGIA